MLNVLFTVDTEIWCSWKQLDQDFPLAFKRYVYGSTPRGDYGLPFKCKVLHEHGLKAVFFVEPLFALRFGIGPLQEIIGLVRQWGHEVQLHLHTEWVDEAPQPPVSVAAGKRSMMSDFTYDDQLTLIRTAQALVERAGGGPFHAFRAGNFSLNRDTLRAVAAAGIPFDSSYNAGMYGLESGVAPNSVLVEPAQIDGVCEVPVTVFADGARSLRHAQLTACSFAELQGLLWRAHEERRGPFVLLSHNSELLTRSKTRVDRIVLRRFERLCGFLASRRDMFNVDGFAALKAAPAARQPAPLRSSRWHTGWRHVEQACRRYYSL